MSNPSEYLMVWGYFSAVGRRSLLVCCSLLAIAACTTSPIQSEEGQITDKADKGDSITVDVDSLEIEPPPWVPGGWNLSSMRDWKEFMWYALHSQGYNVRADGFWTYPAFADEREELITYLQGRAASCPKGWVSHKVELREDYVRAVDKFDRIKIDHPPYSAQYAEQQLVVEDSYLGLVDIIARCQVSPSILADIDKLNDDA